jgi:hypothetical protein
MHLPTAAICPSCGAPLSEVSVLALAPTCDHCGTVLINTGGTLGLTAAYGINDPTITRKRLEADLSVFRESLDRYRGMRLACSEKLEWDVERYARRPPAPEMLDLEPVPTIWTGLRKGVGRFLFWVFVVLLPLSFLADFAHWIGLVSSSVHLIVIGPLVQAPLFWGGLLACIALGVYPHFKAKARNGKRPAENARRQRAYAEGVNAALEAAKPTKAAEDHRLRTQICELEGLERTFCQKVAELTALGQAYAMGR